MNQKSRRRIAYIALVGVFGITTAIGAYAEKPQQMPVATKAAAVIPQSLSDVALTENTIETPSLAVLEQTTAKNAEYANISISEEEYEELAKVVYLEAGNQSEDGQQAVVEVVLNRVASPSFPNSVHEVLHQGEGTKLQQFTTITMLEKADAGQAQDDAIENALHDDLLLEPDVVYFSQSGENDRVFCVIGNHVFCREYVW